MLSSTLDQKFIIEVLKSHIGNQRLASTYLFEGGDFESRAELAGAFASGANCLNEEFCSDCLCLSCKKIASNNHPDVRWVGTDNPNAKSIKIEEIREVLNWVYLRPYEGKKKIFIVSGADRMTIEASNALLKTLEEPPNDTVFCLLVENKSHLLETIQSRSFKLRLKPSVENDAGGSDFVNNYAGIGLLPWEEFIEKHQSTKREEMIKFVNEFMDYIGWHLEKTCKDVDVINSLAAYLGALEAIYEARQALEANANQKLAMSHLTMKLKRAVPNPTILK